MPTENLEEKHETPEECIDRLADEGYLTDFLRKNKDEVIEMLSFELGVDELAKECEAFGRRTGKREERKNSERKIAKIADRLKSLGLSDEQISAALAVDDEEDSPESEDEK